jgi:formylglycine-generating enzyme required for sulfatase activity
MNKRCVIWGVWLAAMVLCLGTLPGLAMADEQDVAKETDEATAPPLAVAPFDAAAAKAHQEAWAKHLGVPVEVTNSIGMKLVLIPPGEFLMGSTKDEIDRLIVTIIIGRDLKEINGRDLEELVIDLPRKEIDKLLRELWLLQRIPRPHLEVSLPQHRVRITKPFYLGMYEVPQAQWESLMGSNPSEFKGPEHPVERVSWNDCQEFIRRLNERPGERGGVYRLPTEAEWEYACRAGTTTAYYHGDDPEGLAQVGNVADRTAMENFLPSHGILARDGYQYTAPVGSFRANGFGLFDMHGNVLEWCQDCYDSSYYLSSPADDPLGPTKGSSRVNRGGSWASSDKFCWSAYRIGFKPSCQISILGFRLARDCAD